MTHDKDEIYVGFWPAGEDYGEFDTITLDNYGRPDNEMQKKLRATLLNYDEPGWKMIVCADYLCLLHLEALESALSAERERDDDIASSSFLQATSAAWPRYVEALNAWYFLLFASCRTGRNNVVLHDFAELSFWHCARLIYDKDGSPKRHAHYGRKSDAYLRRFGLRAYENPTTFKRLDQGIFRDAAFYWGIMFQYGLIQLTALAAKVVAEHRLENYRVAVALAWFELENWLFEKATELGIPTKTKKGRERTANDVLNDFPVGTTVANIRDDLHTLRKKRNKIVHENATAALKDSSLAINCLLAVLNSKSGLSLSADLNPPPTLGLC